MNSTAQKIKELREMKRNLANISEFFEGSVGIKVTIEYPKHGHRPVTLNVSEGAAGILYATGKSIDKTLVVLAILAESELRELNEALNNR